MCLANSHNMRKRSSANEMEKEKERKKKTTQIEIAHRGVDKATKRTNGRTNNRGTNERREKKWQKMKWKVCEWNENERDGEWCDDQTEWNDSKTEIERKKLKERTNTILWDFSCQRTNIVDDHDDCVDDGNGHIEMVREMQKNFKVIRTRVSEIVNGECMRSVSWHRASGLCAFCFVFFPLAFAVAVCRWCCTRAHI